MSRGESAPHLELTWDHVLAWRMSPPLFVAGSTLAVAAMFNPVRRRVMKWVERRFNRSRYDPERIADDFVSRLPDQVVWLRDAA